MLKNEAINIAQNEIFDIAVVDLGWFMDTSFRNQVSAEDAASAGWRILDSIKARNPDTVRILYSARTDEPKITQAATEQSIYCIQKRLSKEGRLHLADVVKVIAHHLSIERDMKVRIKEMESELEELRASMKGLESHQNRNDADERKFRRV